MARIYSPVELLRNEHAVVIVEVLVVQLRPEGQGSGSQGLSWELPRTGWREGEVLLVLVIMFSLSEPVFIRPVDIFLSAIIFLQVCGSGIAEIFSRCLWPAQLRNECRMDVLIFQRSQMFSAVGRASESVHGVFAGVGEIVRTRFRSSFFNGLQVGLL